MCLLTLALLSPSWHTPSGCIWGSEVNNNKKEMLDDGTHPVVLMHTVLTAWLNWLRTCGVNPWIQCSEPTRVPFHPFNAAKISQRCLYVCLLPPMLLFYTLCFKHKGASDFRKIQLFKLFDLLICNCGNQPEAYIFYFLDTSGREVDMSGG